jgi:hypothetical protein
MWLLFAASMAVSTSSSKLGNMSFICATAWLMLTSFMLGVQGVRV